MKQFSQLPTHLLVTLGGGDDDIIMSFITGDDDILM